MKPIYFVNWGRDTRHLNKCQSFEKLYLAKAFLQNIIKKGKTDLYCRAWNLTRLSDRLTTLKENIL